MTIRLSDQGILIHKKQLGETKHVLTFFTKEHGQIKGVGRISKKNPLDLGTLCVVHWSARLEEQLGFVEVEALRCPTTFLLGDYPKLLALQSMMQLLSASLVDRHPYSKLYEATEAFLMGTSAKCLPDPARHPRAKRMLRPGDLDQTEIPGSTVLRTLSEDDSEGNIPWQTAYLHFELIYLEELGFGLDLSKCALTGATEGLYYLSPQTGRAATKAAGALYKEKLFVIPEMFKENTANDFYHALSVTGHFLQKHLFPQSLPQARVALFNEMSGMKKVV